MIQHAFSKPSLVNLKSNDTNLLFYLSVYPLLNTLQTSDNEVIFDFCVDSAYYYCIIYLINIIILDLSYSDSEIFNFLIFISWNSLIRVFTVPFYNWCWKCEKKLISFR